MFMMIAESVPFTFDPAGIPDQLKHYKQWVAWSLIEEGGKTKKLPTYLHSDNTVRRAKWSSPNNFYSFDEALAIYSTHTDFHGLGFVFTPDDPFVGIDLDKLLPNDERHRWVDYNTWSEFSQSGQGVHIIVEANLPKAFKPSHGQVELYSQGRFFALTGRLTANSGMKINPGQDLVDTLLITYADEDQLDELKSQRSGFKLPEKVQEGNRDNSMYQYCCSLFAKGFDEDEVTIRALKANKRHFDPPMEMVEVQTKVGNAQSFIEQQESKARKEITEMLAETEDLRSDLVSQYVFLTEPGKFFDLDTKTQLSIQSFNQSMKDIPTEVVDARGNPKLVPVAPATYLKEHNDYQTAHGLGWLPVPYNKERDDRFLYIENQGRRYANKWRGFALTPVRGDVKPWLRRLKNLIPCKKARKVIIRRMALDIQQPHIKANWQIVIYGGYGAGKDSILRPFQQIFGDSFKSMDGGSAVGSYDDELIGTKILLVNEVENLGRDSKSNVWLKRNSSSEGATTIMLNPKKEAKVLQANVASLYLLSNESDCIKCSPHERRYYVVESSYVPLTQEEKIEYFDDWLAMNGAAALFDFLLRVNTGPVDAFTLPERTEAFYNMVELSRTDWEEHLGDALNLGKGSFNHGIVSPRLICERDLMGLNYKPKETTVAKWLKLQGFIRISGQPRKKIKNEVDRKSRKWYFHKDLKLDVNSLKDGELYDLIDEVEREFRDFDQI
jgi:hypothetical protein